MSKLTQRTITWFALALGVFWLLTTGFQTIAPAVEEPPLVYSNQPFPVESPTYADGVLKMEINRCNTLGKTFDFEFVRVLQSLDGGRSVLLNTDRSIALDTPTCSHGVTNLQLPDGVAPGRYQVVGIITAPGKFKHEHKIPYVSQPFDILPAMTPVGG